MLIRVFILLFSLISLWITSGCNAVSKEETITRRGRVYKIGEKQPFTGTVKGYVREGYRKRKLKCEIRYKNGLRHGHTKFWYANGKLESVEPYANGKINGVLTQYYENGHIKTRIHMVDGRRGGSKGEQFWKDGATSMKDFAKRFFKTPSSR